MAVTYAQLTTQILNYTEVSTDVLSSTITDDFIEHAENRILLFYLFLVEQHQSQHLWLQLEPFIFGLPLVQQIEHFWSKEI